MTNIKQITIYIINQLKNIKNNYYYVPFKSFLNQKH